MLAAFLTETGPWAWWILGIFLLGAELLMPGVFLVWIGLAAIAIGALSLGLWGMTIWHWEVQMLLFAACSVLFVLLGRRFYSRLDRVSDQPLLNQRGATLIGRTATLGEPVVNGRGRLRIDDTYWPVMGPDLPAGSRVVISGHEGSCLKVELA